MEVAPASLVGRVHEVAMPLENEAQILFTETPKYLPEQVTKQTLYSWARNGVRGVKLETLKVGGRFYTSVPAIRRFLAALNGVGEAA